MSSTSQHVGIESLRMLTLVVDDVDEALEFYTDALGFEVRADETFEMDGETGRWVTVAVPGDDVEIGFMRPDEPYYDQATREALAAMRGALWWTFRTRDCEASVAAMKEAGVEISQEPMEREWGTEAMFVDPFGNEFSLFEPASG